jgi:hypothetical protein
MGSRLLRHDDVAEGAGIAVVQDPGVAVVYLS